MKPEFNAGDRVHLINNSRFSSIPIHKEGIIVEYRLCNAVGNYWWIYRVDFGYGTHQEVNRSEINFKSDNVAKNMGLTEKFLSSLKKEPEKSWRKAGITNGDDIPTTEGLSLICTVLLQTNEEIRKQMTKIAKDILEDE